MHSVSCIHCVQFCLRRHDTVFIHLLNKPEWYLDISPAGRVPALVYDGKFLCESLLLADFLDEQYSEPPLWNCSPLQKIVDKIFIESFGKVNISFLYKRWGSSSLIITNHKSLTINVHKTIIMIIHHFFLIVKIPYSRYLFMMIRL